MNPSKNIWLAAALAVAILLGFVAGKMSGSGTSKSTEEDLELTRRDTSKARSSSRYGSSTSNGKRGEHQRGARNIDLTMKTLISQLERSPMANMDFDGMFEVWEIVRSFSEDDVLNALSSVEDIKNPQLRMTMQMMLMNRWGKLNGQAAIEHALKSENKQLKMTGTMGVFMSWTKENPEAAFDWYENNQEELSSGGIYGGFYHGMIYQSLARHDLTRALTQMEKMESGNQKNMALSSIGQAVANNPAKLKKFLKFLDNDGDPTSRQKVMQSVISTMAMQDPEGAKAYVNSINNSEEKKKLTNRLIQSLSHTDPEAAIDWGMEQSDNDEDRKKIITNQLSAWVSQDADAAGKWYDNQPAHLKSDTAVSSTATTLGYMQQYKKAFTWAERVKDADAAKETKKSIYQQWLSSSPSAAKAWAEGEGKEMLKGIDLDTQENQNADGPSAGGALGEIESR